MNHLTPDQLSAYVDGAIAADEREVIERHFASCSECLRELAEMARLHRRLEASMLHDPGEEYFETFAERVQERIHGEKLVASADQVAPHQVRGRRPAHGPLLERLGGWLSGPRLAWAGTVAAVIVGAGVVFMISRETPLQTLQRPGIMGQQDQAVERGARSAEGAPRPLAKQEGAQAKLRVEEETAGRDANEAGEGTGLESLEAKESDRRDALAGKTAADKDDAAVSADARANAPAPPAATGSLFATPPPAGASKPSAAVAPSTARETETMEKSRAREVRRQEGENVPVAESQAPPGAPSGSTSLAAPPREAASRAKTQQARQAAEPLQSSTAATRVCGTVRDDRGRPLAGAQVVIADLGNTARTDAAGRFCVEAPAGTHTLAVMAVGFTDSRRRVEIGARTPDVEFGLVPVSVLADAKKVERSTWPEPARALAEDAETVSSRAMTANTAASWDTVALKWSKTAASLSGGAALVRARANLADARYRAWKLSPTPGRTGIAAAALRSYLEIVSPGAERRKAEQRLEEVEQR